MSGGADLAVIDTIRFGHEGPAVRTAQILLNAHESSTLPLKIDGVFGTLTDGATRGFQGTHQLVPDGVIEAETWRALRTAPRPQATPTTVPGAQAMLVDARKDIERLLATWYGAGKTQAQCGVLLLDYMQHSDPFSSVGRRGLLALALEILR